jgi:hypothetical protein
VSRDLQHLEPPDEVAFPKDAADRLGGDRLQRTPESRTTVPSR